MKIKMTMTNKYFFDMANYSLKSTLLILKCCDMINILVRMNSKKLGRHLLNNINIIDSIDNINIIYFFKVDLLI